MEEKLFFRKYLIWVVILLGQLHGCKSCMEKERNALLELKRYISSITEEGYLGFYPPIWTSDTKSDCCLWEDIKCNRTSGRVTELSISSYLKESSLLNLSLLHPFEELQSLTLYGFDATGFGGFFDDVEGYQSLRRLRNLKILDFTKNHFNNSIFPFLNAATSLTTLVLRNNYMDGPVPIKDLTNLELLDLSSNRFDGSIPVRELSALEKLKALDLSDNEFSGSMESQGICKLKNMQELDLSQNKLVGQIPLCLTSLTGLRLLDLSSNQLTGNVPSAIGNLESIEYLSLLNNSFEGLFSFGLLTNLSKLKVFKLGSTSNSFRVESESSWKPKFQLRGIVLRSCNLKKVPHFLQHQKDLRYVDLSDHNISGNFPSWLLANNTKLQVLRLRNNSLTSFQLPKSAHNLHCLDVAVNKFNHLLPGNIGWILPHLQYMNLTNNSFQGNLPSALSNMKEIEHLDLSKNSFQGKLPRSFLKGCAYLRTLKLSHNRLSGEIFPESVSYKMFYVLTLDNNHFTGIGQGLRSLTSLRLLDISNNKLSGVIPSWFDELDSLFALQISNNSLEGEIPTSLFNMSGLRLLDLSTNSLSGDIPPHVNTTGPVALLLQDNNLSGVIPDTLLANVSVLDLRNNKLSGNIPEFIDTLYIRILLLRGNNLTGRIPRQLCALTSIHLVDLSNNRLSGSIPSCPKNTSVGFGKEDTFYTYGYDFDSIAMPVDSSNVDIGFTPLLTINPFSLEYNKAGTQTNVEFASKQRYDAYRGKNLELLFGMDLSENELSGEIPVELGDLLKLQSLNLSHNNLSGEVPESFSGLKNVESLDLSFNILQGQIPQQLTDLSSLAVFNVSYNNLSGVIPQGRQFNTFDTRSYLGNPLLCGKPTNISCESNHFQEPDNGVEGDESTIDMVSFYWSFAAAYVTILLGILALLSFDSPWSRAWFYIVDAFVLKLMNLLW